MVVVIIYYQRVKVSIITMLTAICGILIKYNVLERSVFMNSVEDLKIVIKHKFSKINVFLDKIGIKKSTWMNWCNFNYQPNIKNMLLIAKYLDLDITVRISAFYPHEYEDYISNRKEA